MLNLSENYKYENHRCICCGKPELDWVETPGIDCPTCGICQACYEILEWTKYSISYLKKIIAFLENSTRK